MRRARGYAAEPPTTGLTASEERSKRLHLRKSSAADIANDCAICRSASFFNESATPQYKTHSRYFCTCVEEKEHTSKRVSIIARNNVISKAQCATCTRLRRRTPYHGADRKRREKQALAFAEIERSRHSQQPDTKCQMQGISAKARLLSVDRRLLRVITLSHH